MNTFDDELQEMKKSDYYPVGDRNKWKYSRRHVIKNSLKQAIEGDLFEFGVYKGKSLRYIAKLKPKNNVYGFDSFEGLPEDWFAKRPKGHFTLQGKLPPVPSNVTLVSGFFDDTLNTFFKDYDGVLSFVHIDCDIYSATCTTLENIHPHLQNGTVILFDEFYGYPEFHLHEIKAWSEFVRKYNINYEYICHSDDQAALRIKM